ncbi:MAG: 50S ribosomal protein L28 [Deltaproteobacteria bacterium]
MARECAICKRKPLTGNNISHSHRRTKRRFFLNLKRVRALVSGAGRRIRVCTRCIRSGFVIKAA